MSSKPVVVIAANDVPAALLDLEKALQGEIAVYISQREINGEKAVVDVPEFVENAALIIESSGSTGIPKKIYLSAEALIASANSTAEYFGNTGQWLLALPINYVAGAMVLVRSILAETQPVVMNTGVSFTAEAFSLSTTLLNAEHRFTSLVPTQLNRLKQLAMVDDFVLSSLRKFDAVLVGGQAVSSDVVDYFLNEQVEIVTTYGSAETAGGCVYNGQALAGVTIQTSTDSTISIAGSMLANGVQDDSGYFNTKDIGVFEGSLLRVLGRADRVINSGGIKIALDEVEAVAATIPGVVEVAATAIESSEWGERVGIAYVGSPEVADYMAEAVFEKLGVAGKPIRVLRVDRIPKLVSGKNDLLALQRIFS
jgi:O-succinylbenzoic acid--CoA ligase